MHVCMYVCRCVWRSVCVCMHACMHCMHACIMHVCVCIYIHTFLDTHIYIYICLCVSMLYICTCIFVRQVCACVYVKVYFLHIVTWKHTRYKPLLVFPWQLRGESKREAEQRHFGSDRKRSRGSGQSHYNQWWAVVASGFCCTESRKKLHEILSFTLG